MSSKTVEKKALPEGWREVQLGEVGVIHSGGTPSTRDDSNWNGSIFWLTPSEVTKLDQKHISSTARKITQKGLSGTTLLPEGCLIVCTRATIGDCCINTVPMAINQGFKCIQPHEAYSTTFLYYILKSLKQQLVRLSCGNTFGEVSRKDFSNILIAVPSYSEQKAIASLLETWDAAIEKTEALIAAKEKRFKWLLKTLISDQQDNPEWRKVKLGDICAVFKGQGLSKDSISKNGKNKCILYGQLYTIYPEIIDEIVGRTSIKNGIFSKKGDILVPGSTTTKGVDLANATALLEDDILLGGDINILRPINDDVYDSAFLAYYLTHGKKREIVRYTQGITIVHLYGKDLKNLNLFLPGVEKQKEIADALRKAVEEINLLKKLAERYSAQKRGLMQQILAGKKRVKIS